jgi:F-type H+-transporting ATPase subunit delta
LREPTIARNYADALFESAEHAKKTEVYGDILEGVAGAVASDAHVQMVLESPRVTKLQKQQILAAALKGRASDQFIRFLSAIIKRGRQGMIGEISKQYLALLDTKLNRVHASVVVARQPDKALQNEVATRLSRIVGKTVVPHFREDPAILGGVVVRIGDRVMDGSLRRQMLSLRRRMLGG